MPLPTYLAQSGALTLTVHELGETSPSPARALLLTEFHEGQIVIRRLSILPALSVPLASHREKFPKVIKVQAGWLKEMFICDDEQIAPEALYEMFSRPTARQILSGHVLALRFTPLLSQSEKSGQGKARKNPEKVYPKFDLKQSGTTITAFTSTNYLLLTNFLETSPLQLLASLEGVSTVTIRNRIQGAREMNRLSKPGSGRRGARTANR